MLVAIMHMIMKKIKHRVIVCTRLLSAQQNWSILSFMKFIRWPKINQLNSLKTTSKIQNFKILCHWKFLTWHTWQFDVDSQFLLGCAPVSLIPSHYWEYLDWYLAFKLLQYSLAQSQVLWIIDALRKAQLVSLWNN